MNYEILSIETTRKIAELEIKVKKLERLIEIKDAYCTCIADIGCDYDGYSKADDLKKIIDELVEYASKAINNDDKSVEYRTGFDDKGKKYNILMEEIKDA